MDNEQIEKQIEEDLRYLGGPDSGIPMEILASTIRRLPREVREWTIENLIWFCPGACNGQALTTRFHLDQINAFVETRKIAGHEFREFVLRIIYIAPEVFEQQPENEQKRIIAHEIAHHWLRHDGPAVGEDQFNQRERQVEALVHEWGF